MIFDKFRSKQKQFVNAVKNGEYEMVAQLIEDSKVDVNKGTLFGSPPLHLAASKGYLEICQLLIKRGANVPKALESTLLNLIRRSWHLTLYETKGRIENHIQRFQLYSQFLSPLTIRPFVYSIIFDCDVNCINC